VYFSEQDTIDLRREAQSSLDRLMDGRGAGIDITAVELPVDPTPPLAIKKAQDQLQQDKQAAKEWIERAREDAARTLVTVAGERYQALLDLIGQYETALDLGEVERSEEILATINGHLEGPEVSGTVKPIIERARAYSSEIESTLGAEASRFASALPRFRENPEAFVARHWANAYRAALTRADAERFFVPESIGAIRIALAGYDQIRQTRRDKMLNREEAASISASMGGVTPFTERGADMERRRRGLAGRQLTEEGGGLSNQR
jgi:hypothetical protein